MGIKSKSQDDEMGIDCRSMFAEDWFRFRS